ncbi:MAG: TonB-dependent receptor [Gammaproteobacteria bacterium]|nr:TonB-dependent receptor [Gammaproteobacteria bacterium]
MEYRNSSKGYSYNLLRVCMAVVFVVCLTQRYVCGAELASADSKLLEQEILWLQAESINITRRHAASPTDVPSPIDVIRMRKIRAQASSELSDMIRNVAPSFNVGAHPISGTSSLIRPFNLRGLGHDHILVLVNGKRRHRAANIPNFSGGINDGTQGPDISALPSIALKSMELMRDGAAAQYGADAIAGVMNFVANDDPKTRAIDIKYGEHYEGDGESITLAGTYGFEVGDGGSLNLSVEYTDTDRTKRTQQADNTQAFVNAGYTDVRDPAIWWGAPKTEDDIKLFANLNSPVVSGTKVYGFASYNKRENIIGFFFRNPAREGVFALGDERIVFDTAGKGGCPSLTVPDLSDSSAVAADLAAIEGLRNDPNCFSFLENYPGGTAPWFSGINEDYSVSLGLHNDFDNGAFFDVSFTLGRNEVSYRTFDNFNPTFGHDSPNSLVVGSRIQEEQTVNTQVTYPLESSVFASPVNLAAGLEWHQEMYKQEPGQREAWDIGPYTATAQGTKGISVGTLGFGAFNPTTSFTASRNNISAYLDIETDVTDNWILGGAVRYEDFNDVGDDTNFKLSSLVKLTEQVKVRGTLSTGFHAPTPGQQQFAQSTVSFNSSGVLSTSATLPASVAQQLPLFSKLARPLKPETSENYSLGFLWEREEFSMTLDFYLIDMQDRITLTSNKVIGDADRAALLALGYSNANQFTSVNFFSNDFATRTKGADFICTVPVHWREKGRSKLALAVNYNTTEVTGRGSALSNLRMRQLEEQLPELRGILSFLHSEGRWRTSVRLNYYGPLTEYYLSEARATELDSQLTLALELGFDPFKQWEFVLGAENLFNSYPSDAVYANTFGAKYPVSSPAGFGGGYYYAKIKYVF